MRVHCSFVLNDDGGGWRIVHEHASKIAGVPRVEPCWQCEARQLGSQIAVVYSKLYVSACDLWRGGSSDSSETKGQHDHNPPYPPARAVLPVLVKLQQRAFSELVALGHRRQGLMDRPRRDGGGGGGDGDEDGAASVGAAVDESLARGIVAVRTQWEGVRDACRHYMKVAFPDVGKRRKQPRGAKGKARKGKAGGRRRGKRGASPPPAECKDEASRRVPVESLRNT